MEIKTCEQYVLAQLRDAQEQCESLEEENSRLKNDLASSVAQLEELKLVVDERDKVISSLKAFITDLKTVLAERDKVITELKQSESDRMHGNTDNFT